MKLRNFINICLALLVLVSNTGLAINVHYCGDDVAAVSVDNFKKVDDSGCCGNEAPVDDSCCKDKKVEIKKTSTENVLIKSFQLDLEPFIISEDYNFTFNNFAFNQIVVRNVLAYHCDSHAPPLYKLYSQLVFYA